jgi:hypothetical protein
MDILAGMLGYLAGIGAVFGALALSFFVFFATPKEPLQAQSEPQSAHAMLARPSASNRPTAGAAHARESAKESTRESARESTLHSEKHEPVAGAASAQQRTRIARDHQRKTATSKSGTSTAQAMRPTEEERVRNWAYQQDSSQGSSFERRFLGYAE